MSGKAMYAVPPVETAIREMSRTVEESEGHVSEFAASFVTGSRSICGTKDVPVTAECGASNN